MEYSETERFSPKIAGRLVDAVLQSDDVFFSSEFS